MNSVNSQFVISLAIIALGYILKRVGILKETDGEAISRIIFNVTLPSIVISIFSTMYIDKELLLMPLVSLIYGIFMMGLALFLFRKEKRRDKGMLAMLIPSFNIGLFAYPLVEAIWGHEGIKYFGMFDMGNSVIIFVLCYLVASIYSSDESEINVKYILFKISRSIPLLAYVITLTLNLCGLTLPKGIIEITSLLSKANMPLSLLLLGLYLSFSFEKAYWVKMSKVLAIRYIVGLLVGSLLYFALPFEPMFKKTVLVGLILPISLSVIPYSVEFDFDKKFVGTTNNCTIVISFVLMWVLISFI